MKENCIRCLPGGRYAIIVSFLKGVVKASMSNRNFGEHFLKGKMLELNSEEQVRVREMKSGKVRGKSSSQRKWHEQKHI